MLVYCSGTRGARVSPKFSAFNRFRLTEFNGVPNKHSQIIYWALVLWVTKIQPATAGVTENTLRDEMSR